MNTLIVGSKKEIILDHLPEKFLLIDDGELIDALDLPEKKSIIRFDVAEHSFNPLKGMDYLRARQFINVLDAVFPEGENTLTRKNSNFILLEALLSKPRNLTKLIPGPGDNAQTDAYQKIQTLLLSPVLSQVLTQPTNFSFKGTILARLNRAELGDFDCFALANLLISLYPGPVVIPDFGFYQSPFHSTLIRQNRLIAGINSFKEVPLHEQQLLLIENKIAAHCTPDDAAVFALYEGIPPGTIGYSDFIHRSINI